MRNRHHAEQVGIPLTHTKLIAEDQVGRVGVFAVSKLCTLSVLVVGDRLHQIVVDASEGFRLVFRTLGDLRSFCLDFLKLFLGEFGIV